jgi:hypothetical protein
VILADTSASVQYDGSTSSTADLRLRDLIAAVSRRHEATLLACDIDLDRVARVVGIELDRPAASR